MSSSSSSDALFRSLFTMGATAVVGLVSYSIYDLNARESKLKDLKQRFERLFPPFHDTRETVVESVAEEVPTEPLPPSQPPSPPTQLVVCTTHDAEVLLEMKNLGVPCELLAPCESDASLSSVQSSTTHQQGTLYLHVANNSPRMSASTCATYALLSWMRASKTKDRPSGSFLRVIPRHDEFTRRNFPYMNTLAVLGVPALANEVIAIMVEHAKRADANVILAFETRALCFASQVAAKLDVPFVSARKLQDSFGAEVVYSAVDDSEDSYRKDDQIAIDAFGFLPTDRVFIVDDVVNTGSTIRTLIRLVERLDAKVTGCSALVQLDATATLGIPNFNAVCSLPPK